MALPRPFSVTVHPLCTSPTPNACAYERGNVSSRNALVYIGGLTSGPHTTLGLIDTVLETLNNTKLGYSVWELRMRSSYTGFGYSSLADDVDDITALVVYLRTIGKETVVLMGSSTGCQDCMEYMKLDEFARVDAYILQGPTSDRETASLLLSPVNYQISLMYAEAEIALGNAKSIMSRKMLPDISIFESPVSMSRWHSLIVKGGDGDYFSSDLDDRELHAKFSRISKPTLILPSENDEMIPPDVDKRALLRRWIQASTEGLVSQLSDLIPHANHTLLGVGSQRWFADRVVRFLESLDGVAVEAQSDPSTHASVR